MAAPHSSGSAGGRRQAGGNLPRTHPARPGRHARAQNKDPSTSQGLPNREPANVHESVAEVVPQARPGRNARRAKSSPKFQREPVAVLGRPEPASVLISRALLDNIARRLDVGRALAVVCRLALSQQNTECDQEVATVLQWSVTADLERQIERLDQFTHARSKTIHSKRGRNRKGSASKLANALAVHVSHSALKDIRYRLSLVKGTTVVCYTALVTQNSEADVDVAAALRHAVIVLLQRQIERICAITNARPKKGQVIAGVTP
jgi:hypothetical protein